MTRYIIKRLVLLIVIIIFVSVVTFFLVHLLPGNPTDTILGPNSTPQNVATLNRQLGLDKPLWQQYFIWIGMSSRATSGSPTRPTRRPRASSPSRSPSTSS